MFSVRHTVRSLCIQHFEHHMFGNQRLCASQTHLERLLAEMSRFCNVNGSWFQSCLTLPCASPPLVRTAMAFPAPLIRSFSKSTCMMEDRRYEHLSQENITLSCALIPVNASYYTRLTQRTNCASLRLLCVLGVPARVAKSAVFTQNWDTLTISLFTRTSIFRF